MKINQKRIRKQQQKAVVAEIKSAIDVESVDQRLYLIELYRKQNLKAAELAELNRLYRRFPCDQKVLISLLRALTERNAIPILTRMLISVQKISQPSTELRLAIARAFTVLRRLEAAAAQYAEIIKTDELTPQVLQQLAEFIFSHQPMPVLTKTLKIFADSHKTDTLPTLLLYIFSRALEGEDCQSLDKYLHYINLKEITQVQIAFDLARLNFRVGNWDKAVTVAKRALEISPGHELTKSLLVSAYSFNGYLDKAKQTIQNLSRSYSPLPISQKRLSTIIDLLAVQKKMGVVGDVIAAKLNDKYDYDIHSENLNNLTNEAIWKAEDKDKKINVSLVGVANITPRAWDVLVNSDWRFPHVIVQPLEDSFILHAFVPCDGTDYWQWQEVPIFIKDSQWLADKNQILFIPADYSPCAKSTHIRNNLLKQAEKELTSVYIQKELKC